MSTIGDKVPSTFNPAIVTASYFASLCGCLLTVELLHRRGTGVHNVRSWLETLSCASTLGVLGIWCMHFIGNRAIVLGDGSHSIQLVYSPGFVTLSAFLPIIGLSIAFAIAEYPLRTPILHWMQLTCTGTFSGLSVVGMHYIGNFGISNYHVHYKPRFLTASVIIAVGDCVLVLALFYTWREKWISSWWKRLLCAILLASGVSAMHFTAATKCIYRLKKYNSHKAIHSRDVQVIIAGVLCIIGGLTLVGLMLHKLYRVQILKTSSQKIMLACAMFDPHGRILVTTEGVLPAREITDKYHHRTFDEEFDTAHPVFQWIFKVTRNWSGVSELIPRMKSHLAAHRMDNEEDSRPESSSSSARYDIETYSDYSVVFRERFCTTASALASSMHIPVHRVGVLYDKIIDTGTLTANEKVQKRKTGLPHKNPADLEMGLNYRQFGKGQLLFLTRQLNADATDKLLNAGFKFGSCQQVGRNIAENMQIPLEALEVHMTAIKRYVDNLTSLEKTGTWLSCFAMIPKVNRKGFEIAVKNSEQGQLPDVQLLPFDPLPWQASFLLRMNEATLSACISYLKNRQRQDMDREPHQQRFSQVVLAAIDKLSQQVPMSWLQSARFYGKPVYAHYSQPLRNRAPVTTLFAFVSITDVNSSTEGWNNILRVPLSFFNIRQQCYFGSPNHVAFARDIHQEFGPLLARKKAPSTNDRVKKISVHIPRKKTTRYSSRRPSIAQYSSGDNTDSSSDYYELVDKAPAEVRQYSDGNPPVISLAAERDNTLGGDLGGILVNSETVVKSDSNVDLGADFPSSTLGIRTAVTTVNKPEDTFVDELVAFARLMVPAKVGR